jgi:hypothetical protein
MELTVIITFCAIFLLAALPLKNYLELKVHEKKEKRWINWLHDRPNRQEYCDQHNQSMDSLSCDYCGSVRQFPSLEMVIVNKPRFGFVNNTFEKYTHFMTHICGGCGTELFRERFEK